jgi:hypothetical protein
VAGALAVGDDEDENEEQAAKPGINPRTATIRALLRPFAAKIEASARSRGARIPDPCIPMVRLYQSQCAILKTKRPEGLPRARVKLNGSAASKTR